MSIYKCLIAVEQNEASLGRAQTGDLIAVDLTWEETVEDALNSHSPDFDPKPWDKDEIIGWSNKLFFGDQEIILSADNLLDAAHKAIRVWGRYRNQSGT